MQREERVLDIELFSHINEADMMLLLQCFGIKTKTYKNGMVVVPFASKITSIGIVLVGEVELFREDSAGNRFKIKTLKENDIFSEDLVCSEIKDSPFSVVAAKKGAEVLFIPYEKVISPCERACPYHKQLIKNILKVIAKNNLLLNLKIDLLGKRTIREKLLTYLKTQSNEQNSPKFHIDLNRNELAEFLCVDRAAMCRELSNMKTDGIINYNKNYFEFV